jgi:hypothetical protein
MEVISTLDAVPRWNHCKSAPMKGTPSVLPILGALAIAGWRDHSVQGEARVNGWVWRLNGCLTSSGSSRA